MMHRLKEAHRAGMWVIGLLGIAGLVLLPGCPGLQLPTDTGTGATVGDKGVNGNFVGAATCSLCHSSLHETWSATRHAKAFEALEAIGEDKNPACLICHTVGNGQEGGFVDRATTNALAGVQCESCHGPGKDHRSNVSDRTLRPPVNISSDVCSGCHNPFHHALFDEWKSSGHAEVTADVAANFTQGRLLNTCGTCHSGDFRQKTLVEGETVSDSLLAGKTVDEMNGVVCATCHNPHTRTNKAFLPPGDHDYQLRYAEVVPAPTPSNRLADAQNSDRFNICGQCHRSREATWQTNTRPAHHSIQTNMYVGEMPVPDGTAALLPNQRSVHVFVPKQCVTCHMPREEQEGVASTFHSSHKFKVEDFVSCAASSCHPSADGAQTFKVALQAEIQAGLDAIKTRLGDPSTWEYQNSAPPGPDANGQKDISDTIKKVRFLYYYVKNDLSLGVHNPSYTRAILTECSTLLETLGK
jgi:hypothetical protein